MERWGKGIIHLADAGAHGKLFTLNDKYPDEEGKIILELEKCALNKINMFGYVIEEDARNSFNESSKIYRNKGGFFEVSDFCPPEIKVKMNMMNMAPIMDVNPIMNMMNAPLPLNNMNMTGHPMMNMSAPMMNMNMNHMQMINNMQFQSNSISSVGRILNK